MIKRMVFLLYISCFSVISQGISSWQNDVSFVLNHTQRDRNSSPFRRRNNKTEPEIERNRTTKNLKNSDRSSGHSRDVFPVTNGPYFNKLMPTQRPKIQDRTNSNYSKWNIFSDSMGNPAKSERKLQIGRSSVARKCIPTADRKGQRCLRKIRRKKINRVGNNGTPRNINGSGLKNRTGVLLQTGTAGINEPLVNNLNNSNIAEKSKSPEILSPKIEKWSIKLGSNSCSCYWRPEKCGCDCEGSLNYDDFQDISRSFFPCQNFTFTMAGGNYYALPPNFFSKVNNVNEFNFIVSNCTFEYMCDPTPMTSPFKNVDFEKGALIKISNVNVRLGWNWKPFEKLRSSSNAQVNIILKDSELRRLTSDFSNLANGHVDTIDITNSNLEMVGSSAFVTFTNMTHFRVPSNKIQQLRRTDFPEMLYRLEEIDLRYNELRTLDEDLFTNMPSLKEISLSGNPLTVLPERTFHNVVSQAKLVGIADFSLTCDCRLQWLKDSMLHDGGTKKNMQGVVCRRPSYLRGIPFDYLSKEHLQCY